MQGLFQELRTAITWFAQEQRESFALLLACEDVETAYVATVLRGLDQADPASLFMTFGHPVRTARAFADVRVESVEMQRRGVNERRTDKGEELWPEMSPECRDPSLSGAARIRALLAYVRARVHPETPLILSLIPAEVDDWGGYAALVRGLLPSPEFEPWMRHVRLLAGEPGEPGAAIPVAKRRAPGTGFCEGTWDGFL